MYGILPVFFVLFWTPSFLAFFDSFFSLIWGFYIYVLWQTHYMLWLAKLQKKKYTVGVKELQRVWILVYP